MPAARTITPSPPASIHSVEVVQVEEDNHSDANERTSLLGSSSRNDTGSAAKVYVTTKKNGRVAKPASAARRPATIEQEAARVQAGQRRILTSIPMQILFFSILATTFASLAMVLILSLNAAYDFSSALLPYRGSGMLEVWIAGLGAWTGFQTIFFFASPVYLIFLVNLLSLLFLLVLFLMTMISAPLRRAHYPLMFVPLGITALTYVLSLLASFAVRRARDKEGKRLMQVLAARHAEEGLTHGTGRNRVNAAERVAAQHEHEQEIAQALVGMEGNGFWKGLVRYTKAFLGFVGSLAGVTVTVLLIANLCLRMYDNTMPLLKEESKMIRVHPEGFPWSFQVHLLCTDAPPHANESDPTFALADLSADSMTPFNFPSDHKAPRHNHTHYPTIIYEAPSGVPGSLAHVRPARVKNPYNPFPQPTPPNNGTDINQVSPYPGSWILSLQKARKVARVCVWDRPGYGFSDSGPVELGMVADSLQQALEKAGEKGPYILVGDGYGGMVTRVFASRHKKQVHSILHIDAQTAQTYFRFPPGWNLLSLRLHRLWDHLLPSLASPLGLNRFYSLFTQYDPSISRVLASKRPPPSTAKLSEKMLRTLLAETYQAHSHDSQSYTDLLKAQPPKYPTDTPAIILSSRQQMEKEKSWAEGQRSLAEEITSETGRLDWQIIKGNVGHDLCSPTGGKDARGRRACSRALVHLFSLE